MRCFTDVYDQLIGRIGLLSAAEVEAVMRAFLLIKERPERMLLIGRYPEQSREWIEVQKASLPILSQITENMIPVIQKAIDTLKDCRGCSAE
jgi:hypothetical protein